MNRSILQTGLPPGFHARHPARHQHPKHALQDEQADLDVQRHLSLRDPASRWRIPQQLSSLTGNLEYHVVNNLFQSCNSKVGLVGGACADVMQTFHRASKYEKKDKFISILNEDGRNAKERTLVFVETKRQADFLCLNLCEEVRLIGRLNNMSCIPYLCTAYTCTGLHSLQNSRSPSSLISRGFQPQVFMATGFRARESRSLLYSISVHKIMLAC